MRPSRLILLVSVVLFLSGILLFVLLRAWIASDVTSGSQVELLQSKVDEAYRVGNVRLRSTIGDVWKLVDMRVQRGEIGLAIRWLVRGLHVQPQNIQRQLQMARFNLEREHRDYAEIRARAAWQSADNFYERGLVKEFLDELGIDPPPVGPHVRPGAIEPEPEAGVEPVINAQGVAPVVEIIPMGNPDLLTDLPRIADLCSGINGIKVRIGKSWEAGEPTLRGGKQYDASVLLDRFKAAHPVRPGSAVIGYVGVLGGDMTRSTYNFLYGLGAEEQSICAVARHYRGVFGSVGRETAFDRVLTMVSGYVKRVVDYRPCSMPGCSENYGHSIQELSEQSAYPCVVCFKRFRERALKKLGQ